jgi:hypothetical protein
MPTSASTFSVEIPPEPARPTTAETAPKAKSSRSSRAASVMRGSSSFM